MEAGWGGTRKPEGEGDRHNMTVPLVGKAGRGGDSDAQYDSWKVVSGMT